MAVKAFSDVQESAHLMFQGEKAKTLVRVIDSHKGHREECSALARALGYSTETFVSAEAFLAHGDRSAPGCLITDVGLQGLSGVDLMTKLRAGSFRSPILFWSSCIEVSAAVTVMKAGAFDFVAKNRDVRELGARIREAVGQDVACYTAQLRLRSLSKRERTVLDLLLDGNGNHEIGDLLDISHRTVEVYRRRLMGKMHADTLAELVRTAVNARLPSRERAP